MALQEELKSQGDYLFKYRSYLPLVLVGITLGIQVYYTTIDIESPTLILKMSNFLQAASCKHICRLVWFSYSGLHCRLYAQKYLWQKHKRRANC